MWAWALLPVLLAMFGTVGLWAVFGIAVSNNTVNLTVEFPYISTCGSYNPQSCLFSQICNICSVLGKFNMFNVLRFWCCIFFPFSSYNTFLISQFLIKKKLTLTAVKVCRPKVELTPCEWLEWLFLLLIPQCTVC
uniref:CWH43-like N-terminal domain-containing protein n=1 Tax=Astyanax mexicanus TaxID=7994 RepID=A0A8B9HNE2_ASTMX